MVFQITLYMIPPALGIICSIIFIIYNVFYKPTYYYKLLIILSSGSIVWLLANTLQLISANTDLKILFNRISTVGIIIVTIYFFVFTAHYTGKKHWVTLKKTILLLIIPIITLILEFTNRYHHLVIKNYEISNISGHLFLLREYGIAFWLYIGYSYILLGISCIMLVNLLINSINFYKKQALFLIFVLSLPLLVNVLFVSKILPIKHIDFTPIALTASMLIMLLGITRLKLGEILPVARSALLDNMRDGLIVIDDKNIVLDINPLAKEIMGLTGAKKIIGKNINKIWDRASQILQEGGFKEIEKDKRSYEINISNFKDYKGKIASQVILFRDITERKKTENSLKERFELSKLISEISTNFIGPNLDYKKKINSALQQIGQFSKVDRSYLYKKRHKCFKKINSWGKSNEYADTNTIIKDNGSLINFLKRHEKIYIDNMQDLKKNAKLSANLKNLVKKLVQKNIKSILIVPIFEDSEIFGFIGFDSIEKIKKWNNEDISILKIAGNMFLNCMRIKQDKLKINYLNFHDHLTNLYNRAYLNEEFKRLNYKRYHPLSFLILDINGLKLINDTLGLKYGDRLVIKVSKMLKNICRRGDIIARWGGDEFAILLPNTKEEDALNILNRINGQMQKTENHEIKISLSIGMYTKKGTGEKINDVIKETEKRLNRQKLTNKESIASSIISSLSQSLWEKSNETEQHAERLKSLAIKLGKYINLPSNKIDELKLLASLHDIGKIGIPDGILEKKDKLNKKEWGKIKTHTEVGYRIAKSSKQLSHIAEGILYHHERWDGSGYPKGLKGSQIPVTSRIISIVDSFDVMVNGRPYKKVMKKNQAIKELKNCSASQFDPDLVEKFIKILKKAP